MKITPMSTTMDIVAEGLHNMKVVETNDFVMDSFK